MAKRLPKKNYRVIVTSRTTSYYHVQARTEEEAEEMIDNLDADHDSFDDETTVEEE